MSATGTGNSALSRQLSGAIYEARTKRIDMAVGIVTGGSGRFWFRSPWDDGDTAAMEYRIRVTPRGVADHIAVPGGVVYRGGVYSPDGRLSECWEFVPPVERKTS